MIRTIIALVLVLLIAAGCGATPGAQAAFQPTPYLPTLAPTPAGLPAPTAVPPPTATAAPSPTETEGPTSSAPPTPTPSITPTVNAQTTMFYVTDTTVAPNQITVKSGQFVRLVVANMGTVNAEFLIQNLKSDNILSDESLAGPISQDLLTKVQDKANNGMIQLYITPQGSAAVSFTPKQAGTFPFVVNIGGHQLSGKIVVQ